MALTPRQAFEAAQRDRLRERAQLLLATDQAAIAELAGARDQILGILAGQPADWQVWQLQQLLGQINAVLEGATGRSLTVVDKALRGAWQQGEDFIDKPLAAGGLNVELQLSALNVDVLTQLRQFAALRLKDVGAEAARKIGGQLSLVTIGARTPFQAIQAVQKQLGNDTPQRATTIVRTEVGRAFAIASHRRLQQARELVPDLRKKWRRSGKVHSRWNHDAADGQVRDVDEAFVLPSETGPVKLMFPHDPTAPAAEVINCGCLALPFRSTWKVATPGAKPFTDRELQLNPRKAAVDQAAQRAGLRRQEHPQALPGWHDAMIPSAKLEGYSLNPDHPREGKDKARVFKSALGYTRANVDDLRDEILRELKTTPAVARDHNGYGQRYQVDVEVQGPKGAGIVRTGWIILDGETVPRLTSAYVRPDQ